MEELKTHQPSMTIDEQVENLKGKGLVISDEEYAKKVLSEISYFRLIKAYSLGLKEKNGYYHNDVSFEQLVELYYFNASFRQITFKEIEKIEVALRCRISNFIADTYGVLGYCDEKNFKDKAPEPEGPGIHHRLSQYPICGPDHICKEFQRKL